MRYLCFAALVISSVCFGQTVTQPLATADEIKYLRFLLLSVGSLDHSPDATKSYENSLLLQFGLSTQEAAVIHSAGQILNTILAQLRQSTQTLVAGKTVLAPADITTLANLNAQREQQIVTLANQILNSVSSTTATRLRSAGHILAAKGKSN